MTRRWARCRRAPSGLATERMLNLLVDQRLRAQAAREQAAPAAARCGPSDPPGGGERERHDREAAPEPLRQHRGR